MAFVSDINKRFIDLTKSTPPTIRAIIRFIVVLLQLFLAVEAFIYFIYLLELLYTNDENSIETSIFGIISVNRFDFRRYVTYSLPIIFAVPAWFITKNYDKITIPIQTVVISAIFSSIYYTKIRSDVITDITLALFVGLAILAVHWFLTEVLGDGTIPSMIVVIMAYSVLINDYFYSESFRAPMWDIFRVRQTWAQALVFALPIGITAVGAAFNERAGVINIGLEGIMLTGAFTAVYFTYQTNNPWVGAIAAIIAGAMVGLVHAVLTITFKAEQIVTGVAVNLLAVGITGLLTQLIWTQGISEQVKRFKAVDLYSKPGIGGVLDQLRFSKLSATPFIGWLFEEIPDPIAILNFQSPLFYLAVVIIPLSHVLLFKTNLGLRIRVIGEHPEAAATAGIPVHAYQYFSVIFSGALAGLGGAMVSLQVGQFSDDITQGKGFLALAMMIFGKWTVIGAAGSSIFLGFLNVLNFNGAFGRLTENTPPDFIRMLPNVFAILALAGFIGRATPPKNIGKPYDPSEGE